MQLTDEYITKHQSTLPRAKYIVKETIDLHNICLTFSANSTVIFRGGSLNNGTIKGSIFLKKVHKGCLNVCMDYGSRILSDYPAYSNDPLKDLTILSACTKTIVLHDDFIFDNELDLRAAELDGNCHSITFEENTKRAIYRHDIIEKCWIHDLTLIKRYKPYTSHRNYALYIINSSNVYINNCAIEGRLFFVNNKKSDDDDKISRNVHISNCHLSCNLNTCTQDWVLEQDHLTFISYKDVTIEECTIESRDVTRVIKTTSFFSEDKFEAAINCTERIVFRNNNCYSDCRFGKQFWDMFCGTVNADVIGNTVKAKGMTFFIENKATQLKYKEDSVIKSIISIEDNNVVMDGGSLLMFSANSDYDNFNVSGNTFTMKGPNRYPQTGFIRIAGAILQGYNSCVISHNSFNFQDEACGLLFAEVNFTPGETLIDNNYMKDVYRINYSSSGGKQVKSPKLVYSNNSKEYSSAYKKPYIEVAFEGAEITEVDIASSSDCRNDYLVQMNNGTHVSKLNLQGAITRKLLQEISDNVTIANVILPKGIVKKKRTYESE